MLNVKKPKRPVFRGEGATAMFEVQIMSDLHLEFPNALAHLPSFEPRAPYLALLGDIGHPKKENYFAFLAAQAARFERVFVVTGNHEYYTSDRDTVHRQISEFCSTFDNLHFLQMSSVLLEDNGHKVRVLGTTLWHHCPEKDIGQVERTLNDYAMIGVPSTTPEGAPKKRKLRAADTNSWHAEEVAWLKAAIAEAEAAGEAVAVLTHHLPSNNSSIAHFRPQVTNFFLTHASWFAVLSGGLGFSTDLEDVIKSPLIFWGYGHTRKTVDVAMQHKSHQTVINGVMVASNQRGYFMAPPEKAGFSPEFVVTIDHDRQSYIMRNDPAKTNQQD
ncbi:Serine/threonine protein phosphatase [Acanthamoeba castellanii str. Neff]|uniref:Serine/threonine protein phosphatase n=1 Tax=Acanthamoeba castellanii (strain ATCC 30010 / Neff) TaxID=1257118 RepID=L8GNF2_ACACF|nr:Serine/threonine protein phosphatase [Acanthamoeba castellanii str. Neff]ELR14512.1 Serine/threonine protein phosphatase [Acanthamoeba castellanii str. Neff]